MIVKNLMLSKMQNSVLDFNSEAVTEFTTT